MIYKEFGEDVAREAGRVMVEYFGKTEGQTTWKQDHSPLTIADTMINNMVISRVKEVYPEHGIHGEESSNTDGQERYLWICDPIDGTIPYMLGMPISTFLLALIDRTDGQPILGIAYNPYEDKMYVAHRGEGVYCNGERLYVSKSVDLVDSIVSIDGSNNGDAYAFARALEIKKVRVQKLNSIAYASLTLLHKKTHASVHFKDALHDVAALKILVEESGGKATDLDGNEQRYDQKVNGIILSNGLVHEEIVDTIRSLSTS